MSSWEIHPSRLTGSIHIPPSKSQSIRALIFAMMAEGKSTLTQLLPSPDVKAMIHTCRLLGAQVDIFEDRVEVVGLGNKMGHTSEIIDVGNSGLILRFVSGLAALGNNPITLSGDHSIQSQRLMTPLLKALSQLGVQATSLKGNGLAPLTIQGPLQPGRVEIEGQLSQFISSLLITAAFAPGPIEIVVENPGEKPWVDLTLHWMDRLGLKYTREGYHTYRVEGRSRYPGFAYRVSGDLSSLAFPLVAALVTQSELTIHNVNLEDPQGDKLIIDILQKMGAQLTLNPAEHTLQVHPSGQLKGGCFNVNACIDATPILAVLGCFSSGTTEIRGAKMARVKECDRLQCITLELQKMGARIEEHPDGLTIHSSPLHGANLQSHGDHRMAMALTVAALGAQNASTLEGAECVAKTYPRFFEQLNKNGAQLVRLESIHR